MAGLCRVRRRRATAMKKPPGPGGPGRLDAGGWAASVAVDRAPGGGHGLGLGRAGAVQVVGRGDGVGAGLGEGLGGHHLGGQGAVPDLLGLGAADADQGAGAGGAAGVAGTAGGRGRAVGGAFGQQVEEVVGDAGRVVHIEVADAGVVAVGRRAVVVRALHVAQRAARGLVDLFADQVVARVVGVGGVELDHGAEDVGGGLVQAAGFTRVDQARGAAGHAVGHLVAGHVQRHQRVEEAAVAVGHAEEAVRPEGVVVLDAVVHARAGAFAVVGDAAAAVDVLVVVPGHAHAVVGVGGGRLGVGLGVGAPGVVRVLELVLGAGAVLHVDRVLLAAQHVGQLVGGAGVVDLGVQAHVAAVEGLAGAHRRAGVDGVPGVQGLAGVGVDEVVHLAGGAVGAHAVDLDLPGQHRLAAAGVDHQLLAHQLGVAVREGGDGGRAGLGRRQLGRDVQVDGGLERVDHAVQGAVATAANDQVAADDRQALVAAVEADVLAAVGVDHQVGGDVLVSQRSLGGGEGVAAQVGQGTLDGRVVGARGGGLGAVDGAEQREGGQADGAEGEAGHGDSFGTSRPLVEAGGQGKGAQYWRRALGPASHAQGERPPAQAFRNS